MSSVLAGCAGSRSPPLRTRLCLVQPCSGVRFRCPFAWITGPPLPPLFPFTPLPIVSFCLKFFGLGSNGSRAAAAAWFCLGLLTLRNKTVCDVYVWGFQTNQGSAIRPRGNPSRLFIITQPVMYSCVSLTSGSREAAPLRLFFSFLCYSVHVPC